MRRCRRSRRDAPCRRTGTTESERSRICRIDRECRCTFPASPKMRREDRMPRRHCARLSSRLSRDETSGTSVHCVLPFRPEIFRRRRQTDTSEWAVFRHNGCAHARLRLRGKCPPRSRRPATLQECSVPARSALSDSADRNTGNARWARAGTNSVYMNSGLRLSEASPARKLISMAFSSEASSCVGMMMWSGTSR